MKLQNLKKEFSQNIHADTQSVSSSQGSQTCLQKNVFNKYGSKKRQGFHKLHSVCDLNIVFEDSKAKSLPLEVAVAVCDTTERA